MEFDIERNKVVGIVEQRKGKESVSIKVIGYIGPDKRCILFSDKEVLIYFPPHGRVFEPGFFINYNTFNEWDLICFKVTVNPQSTSNDDLYQILSNTNNTVKLYGYKVIRDNHINCRDNFLDLIDLDTSFIKQKNSFFLEYDKEIFGEFKLQNEQVVPSFTNKIFAWSIKDCDYYAYKGQGYLLIKPGPSINAKIVDTLNYSDLSEWFRKKLRLINSETINNLNKLFNSEEIAEIFGESSDSQLSLDQIRLKRIEKYFCNYNVLVTDINYLINVSDNLKERFDKALIQYKDDLLQRYSEEFSELEKKSHSVSSEIDEKQKHIEILQNQIFEINSQTDLLINSKERILSDFSIIKEVLGNYTHENELAQANSFFIESVLIEENVPRIDKKDKFLARLRYFLTKHNLSSSLAVNLLAATATFKGTFVLNEQIVLALIEATGNCKYIIQQVEPDWLHFKDLWNNGLGAIWKSSHTNPDILHFLVLEDMNLSSPECYMRPLLDGINGIRKRIPFAMNEFPENLRILTTKISADEPKIGLPLLKQTFKNWGAVGFAEPIDKISEQEHSAVEGYIDSITFSTFKLDDFELKTDSLALASQFKKLFDHPE